MTRLWPGLTLCGIAALFSMAVNLLVAPLSALLVAILLGALVGNLLHLPAVVRPGVSVAAKRVLRIGIVLLGLQLVLGDILGLGWPMVLVVVAVVAAGMMATLLVGRWLGIAWTRRVLIACGFSICGAAAVAAAAGVVGADEDDVATSLGLVVLFGTLMIPVVPLLAGLSQMPERAAGLWAGGSIHEVAQVVAAGGVIGPDALTVAVVVKLARVLMLAPVIAALALVVRRRAARSGTSVRPPVVPLFVVGFLAMATLASLQVIPEQMLSWVKVLQTFLLAAAMFALGLGVRFASLVKVGPRPFVLGLVSTVVVATVAWLGVAWAGR